MARKHLHHSIARTPLAGRGMTRLTGLIGRDITPDMLADIGWTPESGHESWLCGLKIRIDLDGQTQSRIDARQARCWARLDRWQIDSEWDGVIVEYQHEDLRRGIAHSWVIRSTSTRDVIRLSDRGHVGDAVLLIGLRMQELHDSQTEVAS